MFNQPKWTYHNKRKETNINASCLVEFFSRPPSGPLPGSIDCCKLGWVDMMYHLDGRRHRQSLVVYEPQDAI